MLMRQTLITLSLALFLCSQSAKAVPCPELPDWMDISDTTFRVVKPTQVYYVRVQVPDLSSLNCSAGFFEYGTDYYFTLNARNQVIISYSDSLSPWETKRSVSMTKNLTAHSVMYASHREKTPHMLELNDEELGVKYHLYLSREGRAAYAKFAGETQVLKIVK